LSHTRHAQRLRGLGVSEWSTGPLNAPWQGSACFDAVIDTVSAEHAAWLAPSLRANGHLVCVQNRLTTSPVPASTRTVSLHEVALGAAHSFGDDRTWRELVSVGESLLSDMGNRQWVCEAVNEVPFQSLATHLAGLKNMNQSGKAFLSL
jgi:NADPH:quinone reductase-like Zn-dependent oxidoreductase